jgi:aspartyl-tRNA(Asn)/glutamyl-tRNA(Gln) amidotransferase subunit A
MTELWLAGVRRLQGMYDSDSVMPSEVVETLLRRIDRLDVSVGAFTEVFWDQAMEDANRISKIPADARQDSALYGIPVAIKEIFDVKGASITFGSDVFAGRVPDRDAEAVRRLRAAGAIVMGITRSHEFAWGITTQHPRNGGTRNPWDLRKTPGGSSGGSAAAVAMGFVPLAMGTDTGGSIRIPAAFCGVCGFKPSWGKISKRGVLPLAPSLDHVGVIGRWADELSLAFRVLWGWDALDPESDPVVDDVSLDPSLDPAGLRLMVAPALHVPQMSGSYATALEGFIEAIERSGAFVAEVDISLSEAPLNAFGPVQLAEAHHVHAHVLKTFPSRAQEYGSDVAERLRVASGVPLDAYIEGRQAMLRIRAALLRALGGYDALLLPVGAAGPSGVDDPNVGHLDGKQIPLRDLVMNYTVPANLAGLPTCVIPIGQDSDQIPIGVQIIGRPGHDIRMLAIGDTLRKITGFDLWPAIAG